MLKFKASLEHSRVSSKLLLMLGVTTLFTMLGIMSWQLLTGGDASTIESLKILQFFQSLGMFVIPPFILAYFWNSKPLTHLHLTAKTPFKYYLIVVLIMVLLIPFINLLTDINHQLVLPESLAWLEKEIKLAEEQSNHLTEQFLSGSGMKVLFFNILLIAIMPALGEELFFRGSIFNIVRQWKGAVVAIWLTAAIFSAIHFQFYGFVPRLLLGAFFGYLLLWSGNMWLPILAHFVNNLMAVVFFYLKNNGYQVMDIDTIGTGTTIWLGFVSGTVCVITVYFFRKMILNTSSNPI